MLTLQKSNLQQDNASHASFTCTNICINCLYSFMTVVCVWFITLWYLTEMYPATRPGITCHTCLSVLTVKVTHIVLHSCLAHNFVVFEDFWILTLVLLNPDMSCLCKQWRTDLDLHYLSFVIDTKDKTSCSISSQKQHLGASITPSTSLICAFFLFTYLA